MAFKKGEKIKKWIDLSELPTDSRGKIKWKLSVGHSLSFQYGDIVNKLIILQHVPYKNQVVIYINGYTNKLGSFIGIDSLRNCMLGNILKKTISEIHPEYVKYFVDKSIPYLYTYGSNIKVSTKCPFCGTEKLYQINDLCRSGFSCPTCSDGVSWPNKFMYNILKQVKVDFLNEVTSKNQGFEWMGSYRYDFYFIKDGKQYIIEMDGELHFRDSFRTYKESHTVDIEKDKLALEHGIKMIRINCNYTSLFSRFDFIKNNILNSELNTILDLSSVNWISANKSALNSNIKLAATMWDTGIHDKKQIAKDIGISVDAVKKYLTIATNLGLCTYDTEADKTIWRNSVAKRFSKPIMLFKNNIPVNVFPSTTELDRRSIKLYGVHLHKQHIGAVCRGERSQTCGYTMKYITREEYEQLAPQFAKTIQN